MLGALLEATRPKQWVKNLVVFAALLFTLKLDQMDLVLRSVIAFFIFCALSGVVYLINDLADLSADRSHPVKRKRPLARGALGVGTARIASVVITFAALMGAAWISSDDRGGNNFFYVAVGYLLLNLAYSFSLKHIVILDVFAVALGFVLRAQAGAEAIHAPMSQWLFFCTLLGSLFLALGKRRHELVLLEEGAMNHRAILKEYSPYLLDQLIGVVTATTVMAYAMYTFDSTKLFHSDYLWYTIPFVIYGIFRYLYLVHKRDLGGDPSSLLVTDIPLMLTIVLWGVAVWVSLVLGRPTA